MADLALDMVILVYKINSSQDKLEPINEFMYRYRSFVVLMRLCVEQHVVSIRKYAEIACLLESISRQATGWKQYIEGQNKKQQKLL